MGRPTTLNPLAVAFGGALRILRKGKSTKEIADAAALSSTFFRLIEIGRNHISVGKAPLLHAAYDKRLSYEGIVFFLSTIAALEDSAAGITDHNSKGARLGEQAASIAAALARNHPFHIFLKKFAAPLNTFPISVPPRLAPTSNIFEAGIIVQKNAFRSLVAAARLDQECADLPAAYDGYGVGAHQIRQEYPEQFFSDVPSLYKEFFDGLKSSVLAFPRFFAPEVSWEWEKKNYSTLKELFTVCGWNQLHPIENLTRYKFDYLWEKNFKRAVFVLLDVNVGEDSERLKEQFWTNLALALKKRANDKNGTSFDRQVAQQLLAEYNSSKEALHNKTLFRPCPSEAVKQDVQRLLSKQSREDQQMNATWFFRTTDKAFIGAASHIDPKTIKATHIMFLTFS